MYVLRPQSHFSSVLLCNLLSDLILYAILYGILDLLIAYLRPLLVQVPQ